MNLAKRILALRKQNGLSQEEMAEKLGVTRQAVSKWESEQSTPDMDNIIAISELFNATTDYLLKGTDVEKEQTDNNKLRNKKFFSKIISEDSLSECIFINVLIQLFVIFISVLIGICADSEIGMLFAFFAEIFIACIITVTHFYLKSKGIIIKNFLKAGINSFLLVFSFVSYLVIEELNYGDTTLFLHVAVCLAIIAGFNLITYRKKT